MVESGTETAAGVAVGLTDADGVGFGFDFGEVLRVGVGEGVGLGEGDGLGEGVGEGVGLGVGAMVVSDELSAMVFDGSKTITPIFETFGVVTLALKPGGA